MKWACLQSSKLLATSGFHQVCPHKLDYSRIVVAVSEVVIERGRAMLLAGLLHAGQLARLKFVLIDISPIVI